MDGEELLDPTQVLLGQIPEPLDALGVRIVVGDGEMVRSSPPSPLKDVERAAVRSLRGGYETVLRGVAWRSPFPALLHPSARTRDPLPAPPSREYMNAAIARFATARNSGEDPSEKDPLQTT